MATEGFFNGLLACIATAEFEVLLYAHSLYA